MYTNAVKNGIDDNSDKNTINDLGTKERGNLLISSSEEEGLLESSEEFPNIVDTNEQNAIVQFIAATRNEAHYQATDGPSTSREYNNQQPGNLPQKYMTAPEQTPQRRGDELIKEAEMSKARIFDIPGTDYSNLTTRFMRSALMDESFLLVASHLDQTIHDKIIKGEFVDFSRLIPRDRILSSEDEGKMQLVMKGNQSYWVPMNSNDSTQINSFAKWEQAFRVYSDVYTRAHPSRAPKLVQYNHIIHTAAMSYTWDNVYQYDKDFRLHMGRNPERPWSLLLQQAWSLRLKDRLRYDNPMTPDHRGNGSGNGNGNGGGCRRFNRGKCSYGTTCKYEHRCFFCGRVGHGVIVCRQLRTERNDRDQHRQTNNGNNNNDRRDFNRDYNRYNNNNTKPNNLVATSSHQGGFKDQGNHGPLNIEKKVNLK